MLPFCLSESYVLYITLINELRRRKLVLMIFLQNLFIKVGYNIQNFFNRAIEECSFVEYVYDTCSFVEYI